MWYSPKLFKHLICSHQKTMDDFSVFAEVLSQMGIPALALGDNEIWAATPPS
jgi:hypothetical protein